MKNNKTYKQMYDELIQFRQKNIIPQDKLGENHHIKPKSLFPELINDKNNIVRLTLKEHFLAHYYLWKYFKHETSNSEANSKMCCAVIRMTPQFKSILKNEVNNDLINKISEYYEEARIEAIGLLKELSKNVWTDERRKNASIRTKEMWKNEKLRERLSQLHKDLWKNEEWKNNIMEKRKTIYNDPERKMRESIEVKRRYQERPELKEQISTSLKNNYKEHPELKIVISNAAKENWKNEDYRKSIVDFQTNRYKDENERKRTGEAVKLAFSKKPDLFKDRYKQIIQLDMNGNFIREWDSISKASRELKITKQNIISCLKKKNNQKYAGGFRWEYKNPIDNTNKI